VELLDATLVDGDVVLVSGAGDIGGLAARVPKLLMAEGDDAD
jgi:UDP-N-acetylmuramate-alanine ligase